MPSDPVECFLILAHEDELQLKALIERLLQPGSQDKAVVHIDAKSQLWRETKGRFLRGLPNVRLISRPIPVYWAHASMVCATTLLIREALKEHFDLAHLISGSDWPVLGKSARLSQWDGKCQLEAEPLVQSERMNRFWLDSRFARAPHMTLYHWRLKVLMDRISSRLPARASEPWGPWHKGSQWWSLTREACEFIVPELVRARWSGRLFATVCADEHLIQTIMASRMPNVLSSNTRRAVLWEDGRDSPRILTARDWPDILASGAWFARKVSRRIDPFFLKL